VKLNISKKAKAKLNRPEPKPVPEELTPETAYKGAKGWPSDRSVDDIIEAYKSFARLLEGAQGDSEADRRYRKWVTLETTAHRSVLRTNGIDVDTIDIHKKGVA